MLQVTVPAQELWNESTEEFVYLKEQTLQLEHSLASLSKWESRWRKPFLSQEKLTLSETRDYIRCMTLTPDVDPRIYDYLTNDIIDQVNEYMSAPMTATWFSKDDNSKPNREIITNEVIYYWMTCYNVSFECENWHLNRLFTLLEVCSVKSKPPKKMSKQETLSRTASLNAARRKQYNSKG